MALPEGRKPLDNTWFSNHDTNKTEKEYVVVTAISKHRIRYCIPLNELQDLNPKAEMDADVWAKDCVTCEEVEEFSQEWLGETIVDTTLYTENEILELFDKDNDYAKEWPRGFKLERINDWHSKTEVEIDTTERQERYHEYMRRMEREAKEAMHSSIQG